MFSVFNKHFWQLCTYCREISIVTICNSRLYVRERKGILLQTFNKFDTLFVSTTLEKTICLRCANTSFCNLNVFRCNMFSEKRTPLYICIYLVVWWTLLNIMQMSGLNQNCCFSPWTNQISICMNNDLIRYQHATRANSA